MGVLFTRKVDGPAELGVWKITESVEDLLGQVVLSEEELLLYSTFRTDIRRKQWLAYRRLIRELISPQLFPVHYDESGKPFLAGSDFHISVTHTEDLAGVIISREVKVGIDMERVKSRIDKVKHKFLSEEEMAAISAVAYLEGLTLAWCSKEALYKLFGFRNLDFIKNIKVDMPVQDESEFSGGITVNGTTSTYRLFRETDSDLMIVWAIEACQV